MAKSSDDAPKEIGPSDEKGEKDEPKAPRRAAVHVLAAVGAAILAVAAIAVTTWALANRADDSSARPPTKEETSESETSSASPTYWASYGPTLPGTPSSLPTLPSFPTSSFDNDPAPSAPLTFPTSSVPYSTTTSPYTPYTPYTPSVTQTPTVTPTTPTTTPTQTPVKVRPVAPRATRITRCGTFGSLRVAKTTGVRYVRTVGDGLQGRWVVRAYARKGYVVASGATTKFSGNLGTFFPCPGDPYINQVTPTHTGAAETDPWDVAVTTVVPGKATQQLDVTYTFSTEVSILDRTGAGWTCDDTEELEPSVPITCTFAYTGKAPPALTLRVTARDEEGNAVQPHGSVTLATGGTIRDTDGF